jgi:hypothetical protein
MAAARLNSLQEPARPITVKREMRYLTDRDIDKNDPDEVSAREHDQAFLHDVRARQLLELEEGDLPPSLLEFHETIDQLLESVPQIEDELALDPVGTLDIPIAYVGTDDPYLYVVGHHANKQDIECFYQSTSIKLQKR